MREVSNNANLKPGSHQPGFFLPVLQESYTKLIWHSPNSAFDKGVRLFYALIHL